MNFLKRNYLRIFALLCFTAGVWLAFLESEKIASVLISVSALIFIKDFVKFKVSYSKEDGVSFSIEEEEDK